MRMQRDSRCHRLRKWLARPSERSRVSFQPGNLHGPADSAGSERSPGNCSSARSIPDAFSARLDRTWLRSRSPRPTEVVSWLCSRGPTGGSRGELDLFAQSFPVGTSCRLPLWQFWLRSRAGLVPGWRGARAVGGARTGSPRFVRGIVGYGEVGATRWVETTGHADRAGIRGRTVGAERPASGMGGRRGSLRPGSDDGPEDAAIAEHVEAARQAGQAESSHRILDRSCAAMPADRRPGEGQFGRRRSSSPPLPSDD